MSREVKSLFLFQRDFTNKTINHSSTISFSVKDKLKKPKALKAYACTIEQATFQLNPTVEKFEEDLCDSLQEDRLNMQGRTRDGTAVTIVERRLLVSSLLYDRQTRFRVA